MFCLGQVVEDAEPASIDILAAVPPDVAGEILRYLSGIEEHNKYVVIVCVIVDPIDQSNPLI
jgi:hypothetical protein